VLRGGVVERGLWGDVSTRADGLTLAVHLPNQQAGDGGWTNRYQVDGETTTFENRMSTAAEDRRERARQAEFLRDALDLPLTELVLAKA
jgi:hypothetical protein